MPQSVRYTLLADGSSDRVLTGPINWLLRQHAPACSREAQWADLSPLRSPPSGLQDRCRVAVKLYPCDLLVVHRDAEAQPLPAREREIFAAIADAGLATTPHVCLVPVKMTEAWFLFDEAAIRRAAGNPRGVVPLDLPPVHRFEQVDAKQVLSDALQTACEHSGRRRRKFSVAKARHRLAELLDDFSMLRQLPSFGHFERRLSAAVAALPAT